MTRARDLREIERGWTGPMANTITTRVRFAIWDTMRLAATIAGGEAEARILNVLNADMDFFDKYGERRAPESKL